MSRVLRDYQRDSVNSVYAEWEKGITRTSVVLPTGCGKSTVIGQIAVDEARAGGRVLILCHLGEALDQLAAACRALAPDLPPAGRVQANRNEGRRPITTASVQTLGHERRRDLLLPPTLVIVDEAHHVVSPQYLKVLEWAGSFAGTRTMGVTATMVRGDKRGLGDVWESIAYQRDIEWAVNEGWLVRPQGRAVVVDHMDLTKAKLSKGDYRDSELAEMISQDTPEIVKAWQSFASERLTVAFTPNVQSATDLRDSFLDAGVPSELVIGSTPRPERQRIYDRLAAGETRVLVSVMVTTESWDCPPVSCVLNARPTRLPGLFTQMVGRALRLYPGKDSALILDVVGASRHQKLVTLVDLSPSAEYNTDELPPCEDCRQKPCECPKEEKERDPDGGRIKLVGPAKYDEVDLFGRSELNWLRTRAGLRFLSVGDRYVSIIPEPSGTFSSGHCLAAGRSYDGQPILEFVPEEQAMRAAEEWALSYDKDMYRRHSPWRKNGGRPSDKQVALATRLGVPNPETLNKARISDEIDIAIASKRLD